MNTKSSALIIALFALTSIMLLYSQFNKDHKKYQKIFQQWKQQHKIMYQSQSQNYYRFLIFKQNVQKINQHNMKYEKSYEMGVNQFTGMTQQEFKYKFLNSLFVQIQVQTGNKYYQKSRQQDVDINWRQKGAVTPVKNMGQCAASLAFSITPPVQGLSWTVNQKLVSYSQQFIVDCCSSPNTGCRGGFANLDGVYQCLIKKGIATTQKYPYVGVQNTCKINETDFKIKSYKSETGCDQIANLLLNSPVTVFVDASKWMYYRSGIMKCDDVANINHIVSIVGKNSEAWTLKNEWGTSWGQQGFIRLQSGNSCGICKQGAAPFI